VRPQYEGATNFYTSRRDSQDKCGWRALNNILNGPGLSNGFPYLVHWQKDLEYLGYRNNLSMQLIPYDWRLDPKYIVKNFEFKAAVEHLYAMSGKKILISTHSYGINVGYQGMLLFTEEERQKYFKGFVAIGGSWLGAGEPLEQLIGINGGIPLIAEINLDKFMGNLPAMYTLSPKDTYERFKNEDWVKKTLELRDYYNHKSDKKPFDFMPNRQDFCSKDAYNIVKSREDFVGQCDLGIVDYEILAKVGDRTWKISEAEEYLKKYGVGERSAEYYKLFNTYKESAFENLNIPVYNFVANNLSTHYYSTYDELENVTEGTKLSQSKTTEMISGDQTVPLISQIGPGFKWAEEFTAKKPRTKPVKFIHYCNALHNRKEKIYKEIFSEAEWVKELDDQTKNSYLDLDCQCSGGSMVSAGENITEKVHVICGHVGLFQDQSVRNFVFHLLKRGDKTDGLTNFVKSADESYLNKLVETCTIEKPDFLHNWQENYKNKNTSYWHKVSANWKRRITKKIRGVLFKKVKSATQGMFTSNVKAAKYIYKKIKSLLPKR